MLYSATEEFSLNCKFPAILFKSINFVSAIAQHSQVPPCLCLMHAHHPPAAQTLIVSSVPLRVSQSNFTQKKALSFSISTYLNGYQCSSLLASNLLPAQAAQQTFSYLTNLAFTLTLVIAACTCLDVRVCLSIHLSFSLFS